MGTNNVRNTYHKKHGETMNRNVIYYIIAAVLGGIAKDMNEPTKRRNWAAVFFTSMVIGIIFGNFAFELTGRVDAAIAFAALGGTRGWDAITFLFNMFKKKLQHITTEKDGPT